MTANNVVIGGGTGFIGKYLVHALKKQGFNPIVVSRMPGPFRISWHDLERDGLPKDTTAVINVAGQNILDMKQRWSSGFKQNVWNSRVETTKTLARAVSSSSAKVFVTISGVAYYPPDDKEYDEYSVCESYDFLSAKSVSDSFNRRSTKYLTTIVKPSAELCHAWEDAAKLSKDSGVRRVTVRSGVVLGRDGGMVKQIYIPFYFGLGGPLATGKQPMPWIHVDDITRMFVHAVKKDDVSGVLNGVAPQIVTNEEFTKAFASALWRPAKIPVPEFVLNTIFNKERAKIMTEGQKVVPKRVLESGFTYKYPTIEAACDAVINW